MRHLFIDRRSRGCWFPRTGAVLAVMGSEKGRLGTLIRLTIRFHFFYFHYNACRYSISLLIHCIFHLCCPRVVISFRMLYACQSLPFLIYSPFIPIFEPSPRAQCHRFSTTPLQSHQQLQLSSTPSSHPAYSTHSRRVQTQQPL
jgi:hypothetical protein